MKQSSNDATQPLVAAMRRVDTTLPDIRRERNAQRMRADIATIAAQFAGRDESAIIGAAGLNRLRWRRVVGWLVPATLVVATLLLWLWPIATSAVSGHAPELACLTPFRSDNANALPRTKAYLGGHFDQLVTGRDDVLHVNLVGTSIQVVMVDQTQLDVQAASAGTVEIALGTGLLVVENRGPTRLRIRAGTQLIEATYARFAVYREGDVSVVAVEFGPVVLSSGIGEIIPVTAGQWPSSDVATGMVARHGLWRWLRALSIQPVNVQVAAAPAEEMAVAPAVAAVAVTRGKDAHRLAKLQPAVNSAAATLSGAAAELYRAAEAALAAGDSSTASATWQTLIARFPDDERVPTALYDLATVARRTADYQAAARWLNEIPATAPASLRSNAAYMLCRLELDRSQLASAATCLRAYRQHYTQSVHDQEVLQWLVAYHRNHSACAVTRDLAQEYMRRYGDFEFAVQAKALLTCEGTP